MHSSRLVCLSVLLAGCGGGTPEPAVGATPSEVQVVAVAPPPEATVEAKATPPVEAAKPAPEKTVVVHDDEARSVEGALVGADGEAHGFGGLGLGGTGRGIGSIGTIGHGAGVGTGQGFGNGHGRLGGAHGKPLKINAGATNVKGPLPPEVIRRIVQQKFGQFRLCYESGLRSDPKLEGKFRARFVIEKTGAVSNATNAGSDLKDSQVIACVLKVFGTLRFPAPEGGGVVVVEYPLGFSPPDPPAAPPATKPTP
jgi:hypothetical protein